MLRNPLNRTLMLVLALWAAPPARAETTLVAVAANFIKPMAQIAELYTQATGHTAQLSFGSSGKFVAQIENGAPFEVFLSADQNNPRQLEDKGLAVPQSRFTYAIGTLVLWSAQPGLVDGQGKVLADGQFKHLAVADPKLAPYGAAAMEVLAGLGLAERLRPRLVLGENIAQTHQFISTGNAELGFVALSQVATDGKISQGSGWIVPGGLHSPIRQDAVLLKKGVGRPAAEALLAFLKSAPAKAVIGRHGYRLPD